MNSIRYFAGAALAILAYFGAAMQPATADVTVVTQVTVTGLTRQSNGNISPPTFPITYTTYFQGDKSRLESSDGTVLIFDQALDTVYELNPKSSTYYSGSIKQIENFSGLFPQKLAKRLTVAEDLNFFPDSSSATYLNTSAAKFNVTGAAHYLIEHVTSDDDSSGAAHHRRSSGDDDGSGNAPPDDSDGPGTGGSYPVTPGLQLASPPQYPGGWNSHDTGLPPETNGGDTNPDGDSSSGSGTGDDKSGGDNEPTGDSDQPRTEEFRHSSVPDFYIAGAIWQSSSVKLPKERHDSSLPIALQIVWAGGPFLTDLLKQLDQNRQIPLHSEFSIRELYPQSGGESAILLNSTIKTEFDVKTISTSPCDPALFSVPQGYTKTPGAVVIPQIAVPYIEHDTDIGPPIGP